MDSKKYIGMDLHKESISIAVRNAAGKIVMDRNRTVRLTHGFPQGRRYCHCDCSFVE
jgi:hypothetical protein